ncbi:MAG TPA: GNAT family N-acetyltransferase [Burkholderiales bacterium]|nr:GNAT family N-acetyltransferase [Burkholderiales bacterium]
MEQPTTSHAPQAVAVRAARAADLAAVQAIYAHHVLRGLASFEEQAPDLNEMRRRFDDLAARGLPYLVGCIGDVIAGYGYCAPYRARSAYRYVLEDSVYVDPAYQRRGVGRALLAALIERCTALGYRQLIAVIGDSAHAPSIGVHVDAGFLRVGTLRSVGFKLGRWVDTVIMQRPLGTGDGTKPGLKPGSDPGG